MSRALGMFSAALAAGLGLTLACAAQEAGTSDGDPVQHAYQLRLEAKVDQAKAALDREVAEHPDNALAWFETARLEFYRAATESSEMDAAQQAIEKALAVDPDNVRYLTWAGRIAVYNCILKGHANQTAEMRGQMDRATAALEKAVAADPDCHEARLILVSCYGNNPPDLGGDRDRAEAHVKTLEQRSPVYGAEARCEFDSSKPDRRLEIWGEVAQKYGASALVHENLARQYAHSGDVEKAKFHADAALKADPTRGMILLDLGLSLAFDRKLEPAQEFVQRYLEREPAPPAALRAYALMVLGRIQKMQGDAAAADETLKRAKATDPYCWFTMRPPPAELFEAP